MRNVFETETQSGLNELKLKLNEPTTFLVILEINSYNLLKIIEFKLTKERIYDHIMDGSQF